MEDSSTHASETQHLILRLEKSQHELLIMQKKNAQLTNENQGLKEAALKSQQHLKEDKEKHEAVITRLGFKMLHFENELRKEERQIERRFIEKDQQINLLNDTISSLQAKLKTNTLCQNCFKMKHNAIVGEHGVKQENFIAKFPLDLDFEDHKNPGHDSRGRSLSLPLSLSSHHDKGKSAAAFCFYHDLSPVPEELEVGFLEHARKVNQESIIEEEDVKQNDSNSTTESETCEDLNSNTDVGRKKAEIQQHLGINDCKKIQDESRKLNQAISQDIRHVINDLIETVKVQLEKTEEMCISDKEPSNSAKRVEPPQPASEEDSVSEVLHKGVHSTFADEHLNLSTNLLDQGSARVSERLEEEFSGGSITCSLPALRNDFAADKMVPEKLSPNSEMTIAELVDAVIIAATLEIGDTDADEECPKILIANENSLECKSHNIDVRRQDSDHDNRDENEKETAINDKSLSFCVRNDKDMLSPHPVDCLKEKHLELAAVSLAADSSMSKKKQEHEVSGNYSDTLTDYDVIELD